MFSIRQTDRQTDILKPQPLPWASHLKAKCSHAQDTDEQGKIFLQSWWSVTRNDSRWNHSWRSGSSVRPLMTVQSCHALVWLLLHHMWWGNQDLMAEQILFFVSCFGTKGKTYVWAVMHRPPGWLLSAWLHFNYFCTVNMSPLYWEEIALSINLPGYNRGSAISSILFIMQLLITRGLQEHYFFHSKSCLVNQSDVSFWTELDRCTKDVVICTELRGAWGGGDVSSLGMPHNIASPRASVPSFIKKSLK